MRLKALFRGTPTEAELVTAQTAWRRASIAATEAYRSWGTSARDERWLAYAAYQAALEQEEYAAAAYQQLVERIQEAHHGGPYETADARETDAIRRPIVALTDEHFGEGR